jgi:hypothetical protein
MCSAALRQGVAMLMRRRGLPSLAAFAVMRTGFG